MFSQLCIPCLFLLCLCTLGHVTALQWHNITDAVQRGALCNDFSAAGFFLRRNSASTKWVIFLEGGGVCGSPGSCNERFIDRSVREKYTGFWNGKRRVDVEQAWRDYSSRPLVVTSKLMTSLWRFLGMNSNWTIEGTDILSTNVGENPDFYSHNHVVLPYCSSDLWLKKSKNFALAQDPDFRFEFDPTATEYQFTFRGVAILRSVIGDLFEHHGLSNATDVLFAGSSAGGVGVFNHAMWLKQQLEQRAIAGCKLAAMLDSAWFINFKGNIEKQFAPEEMISLSKTGEILENCAASPDNPVACLSAPAIISNETLYPDIPTLSIFSLYDPYFLVRSLSDIDANSQVFEIMRVISEYSGSMNTSLLRTKRRFSKLSYYVTSCFQHVYLATSSLWGEGETLFGTAAIDGTQENNQFMHMVQSGVWRTYPLLHLSNNKSNAVTDSNTITSLTIAEAIHNWLLASKSEQTVGYQDSCSGPHCNQLCPDLVVLGQTKLYWGVTTQGIVIAVVVCVCLLCATVKLVLFMFGKYSAYCQLRFLEWKACYPYAVTESAVGSYCSKLPPCKDSDAISVACLNLRYSVTLSKSALKKAHGPALKKRLLSIAAADERCDSLPPPAVGRRGDPVMMGRLNSETGQPELAEEGDLIQSIRQFQDQYRQRQAAKKRLRPLLLPHRRKQKRKKEIIRGISTYFNPGELVAIMGPSGSGKTTFLDLLAGRRNADSYQGEIFINGIPVDEIRDWYIANTGYVLQLATPYYEELTVRENLTLAAAMRLPASCNMEERFERVEQVLKETGLASLSGTHVGGSTGPGLSGGQKRRLCVAVQLLSMPSLVFLDEPTSGLDAASSLELLTHLHRVAASNRAVILTIHQPRLEIFHMFHKIILLCQGQVAYHGIPEKAYEVFMEARRKCSRKAFNIASVETKNPADVIMDMLGSEAARTDILNYYQHTYEPRAVENAIESCRSNINHEGKKKIRQKIRKGAGALNRLMALETRAKRRTNWCLALYLPVVFITYGLLLGTVYLQTSNATFILSGFGVFSCASGLFMFPVIYSYLHRAMEIFSLEHSDGVGRPSELIVQTFVRFTALSTLPILLCSLVLYLLVIPCPQYSLSVFTRVTVFNLALNQTWVGLLVLVVTAQPGYAHRISPVLSAIAGFAGGFFVPPRLMPSWYQWLFYINPNYYGFSAMARVLLEDIELPCPYDSIIECYPSSGRYILTYFNLHDINPYLHITVLLGMTAGFLALAWLAVTLQHSYLVPRVKKLLTRRSLKRPQGRFAAERSTAMPSPSPDIIETPPAHEEEQELDQKGPQEPILGTLTSKSSSADPIPGTPLDRRAQEARLQKRHTYSKLLEDGERHEVWTPGMKLAAQTNASFKSLDDRRKTLFQRMTTYRSCASASAPDIAAPASRAAGWSPRNRHLPSQGLMEKRLQQWRKLEEEASREAQWNSGSTMTVASNTTASAGVKTGIKFPLSPALSSSVGSDPSELETPSEVITPCPNTENPQLPFSVPKSAPASPLVSSHSGHPFSTALSKNSAHSLSSCDINLIERGRTEDQVSQHIRPCTTPLAINFIPAPRHLTGQIFVFPDPQSSLHPAPCPESQPTNDSSNSNNSFVSSPSMLVPPRQRSAASSLSEMDPILEEESEVSSELTSSCQLHEDTDCVLQASSHTEFSCLEETGYPPLHIGTVAALAATPRELQSEEDLPYSSMKAGFEETADCESDTKAVCYSDRWEASSFLPFQGSDPADSLELEAYHSTRSTVGGWGKVPTATIEAATIEEDCGEKSCPQKQPHVAPVHCSTKEKALRNSGPGQDGPHPTGGQRSDNSSTAKPCSFQIRLPSKPIPMSLESSALHEHSVPITQVLPQAIATSPKVMYVGRVSASLATGNVRGCQKFGHVPPQMQYTQTDI